MTDPLEAQALELIGLDEQAGTETGLNLDELDRMLELKSRSPAIARAYLEARAEIERLKHALGMGITVWSGALAHRYGGAPEEQREPVLNAMRAALHPQPDTSEVK